MASIDAFNVSIPWGTRVMRPAEALEPGDVRADWTYDQRTKTWIGPIVTDTMYIKANECPGCGAPLLRFRTSCEYCRRPQ